MMNITKENNILSNNDDVEDLEVKEVEDLEIAKVEKPTNVTLKSSPEEPSAVTANIT